MDPIATSSSKVNVPKLDDAASFLPWQRCVLHALQALDLVHHVDGTAIRPIRRENKEVEIDPKVAAQDHADEIKALVDRLAKDPADPDFLTIEQFQLACSISAKKASHRSVLLPLTPDEIRADSEAIRRFETGQSLAFGIIAGSLSSRNLHFVVQSETPQELLSRIVAHCTPINATQRDNKREKPSSVSRSSSSSGWGKTRL